MALSSEQLLELWVRNGVEVTFEQLLGNRLSLFAILELKQAMF